MKRILLILICLAMFNACALRTPSYRDDVEIEQLQKEVDGLLYHTDSLITYHPDDIRFYLDLPESYCDDCVVRAQTSSLSIDEYGIFRCANEEEADELEDELEDYLERSLEGKRDWLQSYNPSELVKLENGRIKRYGNYVFYGILDPSTERLVASRLKDTLRKD